MTSSAAATWIPWPATHPRFARPRRRGRAGPGPEGEKQRAKTFRRAFSDLQVAIEDMVAEGDRVSARIMARGTQRGQFLGIRPTGNQASSQTFALCRIVDGRPAERWGTHDYPALLHQVAPTSSGLPI